MAKCGRECEVFSRVVGYYRPVRNWNRGKQEEFRQRTPFDPALANAPFKPQEKSEENPPKDVAKP